MSCLPSARLIPESLVWTAPFHARAELCSGAAVGCGHVSGLLMRLVSAGPDAIRGLAPNQFRAFADARLSTGSARPRVRPMCHHATSALTRPPVAATSGGKLVVVLRCGGLRSAAPRVVGSAARQ